MKLELIKESQFPLWKEMRQGVYHGISDGFHEKEMNLIFKSSDQFCYFLIDDRDNIIGMVELSSRNIVDGCLTSPVAYIEGIYLKEEHRNNGLGQEAMNIIKTWCKKNGFAELAMDTEISNKDAQAFFKAIGFTESYRVVQFNTKI